MDCRQPMGSPRDGLAFPLLTPGLATSITVLLPNPPCGGGTGCRGRCRRSAHKGGQAGVTYDCNDGIKGIDSVGVVGDNSAHTANSGNGSYDSFSGFGS